MIVLGVSALSTTAMFAGLWLTGIELNITAIMGMTMIIDIGIGAPRYPVLIGVTLPRPDRKEKVDA